MLLTYCLLLPFCAAGIARAWHSWGRKGRIFVGIACAATAVVYFWGSATALMHVSFEECTPLPAVTAARIASGLPPGAVVASNSPWEVSYSTNAPTVLLPHNLDEEGLRRFTARYNVGKIVLLGNPCSRTARAVHAADELQIVDRKSRIVNVYGQNAYEGRLKTMPQMVQKLPITHSPRITPRKNGSARL